MSIKKGDPEWQDLSLRNDLGDAIWKACSDGYLLHKHLREIPRGAKVAAKLPGSASGAWVIACGVVQAEQSGSAPSGFSSALLAHILAAQKPPSESS
jgi:hypothetical protein